MKLPTPQPPQWVDTARKLRQVRRTCLLFLDRWAISQLLSDASALDRVAGDIHGSADEPKDLPTDSSVDSAIADHSNRDWSILYRGSVLDD
jgi:hypothetical protein